MNTTKYILCIFFTIISLNLFSQNEKIDKILAKGEEASYYDLDSSLMFFNEALDISIETKNKEYEAISLGQIGRIYYYMNEVAEATNYFQQSLDIALEIEDYLQAAKMCNNLGLMNLYTQEYDKAYDFFKKQLTFSTEANDSTWISDSYNNFGSYFLNQDLLDSAINNYEIGLKIAEQIDYKGNIATINSNLAIVYHTKGNLPLALKYNLDAARIFQETGDLHNYAITASNIGAMYIDNNEFDKAKEYLLIAYNLKDSIVIEDYYLQTTLINLGIVNKEFKDLDKAERFFLDALDISIKNEDVKNQITVYLNLITLYIDKKDNQKALEYGNLALQLSEEIESEQLIASSYKKLGSVYNAMKNYTQAIYCLKIAYQKSIDLGYLTYILDVLDELKFSYKSLNDYKSAFETDELIIVFQDSLTGIETQKQLSTLATIYETEKKEQEIEKQKLEITAKNLKIKQGNLIIFTVSAVLLLVIILIFVLFSSIKAKKKANRILKEQKIIIEEKNEELGQLIEEISTQKEEIEAQRDLANAQKSEIISSINYAKRIQNAVLPSTELMDKILPEHFILFKPRNIVSGDFYWVKQIHNLTIVATADCTGHGVPGAFMSMLGSAFLNEIVTSKSLDTTGKILNELRNRVKKSLKQKGENEDQKDGMDMALYAIDTETNELQFSGAYNPLYIIRNIEFQAVEEQFAGNKNIRLNNDDKIPNKTLIEIKPDRQPISVHVIEEPFTTKFFRLKKNDCLYTFSDGFSDQFGEKSSERIKSKAFKSLLLSISEKPLKEQNQFLNNYFENWRGLQEQTDDVLVIGVKI
ncbi:MAG: tetratricopeptide repeat protein [Bacteroidales bacterium]|nr:tetratricopeptide repeat protein [Bacteroidales bacterium]